MLAKRTGGMRGRGSEKHHHSVSVIISGFHLTFSSQPTREASLLIYMLSSVCFLQIRRHLATS